MSLSFLEGLGAFAQGVQERSSEIDADLAERIKELNDKAPDENLKSRFADEYARWTKDRDLIESVKSAGGAGTEQGQFLLGGYDSIEAYREAYARDNSIYHTLFNIGDAPVLTPTQYGLTNLDSSGKTRTTASKLFNKAFRPEIYEKNQEYADNKKDVEGSTTKYFRREGNANTDEVIAANKTKLSTTFTTNKPSELPDTLTIHKEVDGVMMTYFLSKTNEENKEMGTSLEGFDDYRVLGDPTRKNAPSEFTMKLKAHTDTKPEDAESPTYEKDLEEWTYKYNKLMFGETFKEGPKVGEIISGVYNNNDQKVNIQYTGKTTDSWNGMEGYIQFGAPEPESTPSEIKVNKMVDGVMMTYSLMKTNKTNIGTALEDFTGYRVMGEPVRTKDMSNLEEKLAEHGEAPLGADFDIVEDYEEAKQLWQNGYNKILFGVTSLENVEGPKVGTITSGVYDKEGNKVNVQYTGKDTDSFMSMKGYVQFGGAAPDSLMNTTKEYYDSTTNTIRQLIYKGGEQSYKGLKGWQPFGDAKPVTESYNLQTTYNKEGQEVKVLRTGNNDDSFEGTSGWLQIGEPKETASSKLSASDLKWKPMQIIVDAITSGGVVSEEQLAAAEFIRASSDSAMEVQFADVLQDWESITIMVRDFSMLRVNKVDANGKATNETVYMTQKNIKEQAGRKGLTIKTYRKRLLKIMQGG